MGVTGMTLKSASSAKHGKVAMTDMPKRIWAWEPSRFEGYWGDDPCFVEEQGAVEYIRADSVPDVDVEDLAHEVRDAAFKTYGVIIDPVWLEHILRKALEVHSD